MKRRDYRTGYLRGLGIGIVVTALILTIGGGKKEELTDGEIKARAAQLGMVESGSVTLAESAASRESTESAEIPKVSETPENAVSGAESPEAPEAGESVASEAESTEVSAEEEESADSAVESPEASSEGEESAASGEPSESTVVIEHGASSYVCKQLAEAGFIENAEDYDTYLCGNGYSRKLRGGTHQIPAGATWEEIAEILTGNR